MSCQLLTHRSIFIKLELHWCYTVACTEDEDGCLILCGPNDLTFSEHSSLASQGSHPLPHHHPRLPSTAPSSSSSAGGLWRVSSRLEVQNGQSCPHGDHLLRSECCIYICARWARVCDLCSVSACVSGAFDQRSLPTASTLAPLVGPDVCCRFLEASGGLIRMVTRVHILACVCVCPLWATTENTVKPIAALRSFLNIQRWVHVWPSHSISVDRIWKVSHSRP